MRKEEGGGRGDDFWEVVGAAGEGEGGLLSVSSLRPQRRQGAGLVQRNQAPDGVGV